MTIEAVFAAALALPEDRRRALAEKLLESLVALEQGDVDAAWVEEARQRLRKYQAGTFKAIPGDKAFRNIRRDG